MITGGVRGAVKASLTMAECLQRIRTYHTMIGWPKVCEPMSEDQRQEHITLVAAMQVECAEVMNAAPWKPWKNYVQEYAGDDSATASEVYERVQANVAEELVDMLFFVTAVLELWGLSNEAFEAAFEAKLEENKRRLEQGYNKVR